MATIEFNEDLELKNGQPTTRELVAAGDDLRFKFGLSGENPEQLIATKGWAYIDDLEKDTHHASTLHLRVKKLLEKGWEIDPFKSTNGKITARNQTIRDFCMWNVEAMQGSFEKDIEAMLFDALSKGFSLTETNYQPLRSGKFTGKVGLKSLRRKPPGYFSFQFDTVGHFSIVQIDPDPGGVDLPRNKFLHLINGPNDENPYGDSLTAKNAFWIWLKKNQAKFWAIFNERFGKPLVRVTVPRSATEDELKKAKSIIEETATRAGIRVPENFEVDFLEATRRGDITYDNFVERCNKEISKTNLGATLVNEEGSRGQGSYAHSTTHATLLDTASVFDAAMTAVAITEQLLKRLININFNTDEYPYFRWSGMSISELISMF